MTPAEIQAECRAIAEMVGVRAHVYASVDNETYHDGIVVAALYPRGVAKSERLHVYADTFEGAFAALRAKWDEHRAAHDADATRRMALAIIETTEATGQCTDAALRQHFDASEIARLGAAAVKLADEMAGNGPFSILHVAGQNAV